MIGLCRERGDATTFVLDSQGTRYLYQQSSGIGEVCGVYGQKSPLSLGPGARATTVFTFRRLGGSAEPDKSFSFISEHAIVQNDPQRRYRAVSRQSIALRDIEAR